MRRTGKGISGLWFSKNDKHDIERVCIHDPDPADYVSATGLWRLVHSRREPILAALLESGQSKPQEENEHHHPGRQFWDGLLAACRRNRGRRWVV
jgi:hypothetical protein